MSLRLVERLDRVLYPGHGARWDDDLLRAALSAETTSLLQGSRPRRLRLLDLGAGAGITGPLLPPSGSQGTHVVGLDPDVRVLTNPHLDEAHVGHAENLPFPQNHFDLVVANNVVEHLVDPGSVFAEVHRVLRRGGVFLFKTPNRMHYVPLLARVTPHAFHRWVNERRGREPADTFPTVYRANRPGTIRRLGLEAGFASVHIDMVEGRPEYLRLSAPTYLAGWAWERAVNGIPSLGALRLVLLARLGKEA